MSKWKTCNVAGLVVLLLGACTSVVTARDRAEGNPSTPRIISPQNHQRLGEGEDPLCPPTTTACYKIRAEGQVPSGLTPFFGVEPGGESPRVWIQPPIRGVGGDGTFTGLVYLGEEHNGAKQYFKIYVLACKDPQRLHNEEEILEFPKDCLVSDPVEVYRTR